MLTLLPRQFYGISKFRTLAALDGPKVGSFLRFPSKYVDHVVRSRGEIASVFNGGIYALSSTNTFRTAKVLGHHPSLYELLQEFSCYSLFRTVHCEQAHTANRIDVVASNQNQIKDINRNHESIEPNSNDLRQATWIDLWKWAIRKHWKLVLIVGLVAIGSALVNIAVPKLIGRMTNIISSLISSNSRAAFEMSSGQLLYQGAKALKAPAVGLFFLFGLQGLLTFIYISAVSILGEKVAVDLRLSLYDSLISQDMQFFDSPSHKTTNLLECLSQDVSEFKHSFKLMFTQGLKHFVQLTGSAVGLLLINPSLTAILVSSLSVGSALGSLYGGYLRKLSRDAKEKEAEAVFYASEALGNMKTVRAFGNESQEKQRFFKQVEQVSDANLTLGKNIGIFQGFLNFGIGMMILGVLYVGGDLVTRDRMSGGDLMSYLLGIQSAQKSFSSISIIFAQSVKAWSSLGRIICYLKLQPSIPLINGETLPTIGGDIAFRNVDFAYPSRPNRNVFQNFCLEIPSGKMVALCGESGSGKSTAAALIERFYDPQSGSVLLDGKDIKTLDPTWLRKNIGFINQEPVLFACSILENIRYAKPEATKDEVLRVAQDANAHEFIEKFPDGYDTIVGERGTTLSGGQKQRIAIARALLKNPKILILDEATSALDATSEKVVQEALDRVLMNRTVLVIAHRLSTIENAHKIVVLGPEGVIEQGTHIDLIQKNGAYARLYNKAHMD